MLSSSGTSGARRYSNRSAQRRRRQGGSDPYLAGYAPLCAEGSCSECQPTQEPAHQRFRKAKERALWGLCTAKLVAKVSGFRPGANPSDVQAATKFALRSVARRHQRLSEEISELDEQLDRLVAQAAPELVALEGVGTDTAASLLIAAGDNPERLRHEAAFAHLCGAAPIPASSGKKSVRHRLNRHGNRDARAEPSTSSPYAA
jgi:transposase